MLVSVESRPLVIALIGNPNTGKSTLFNALCGVRQRTGNYPGVTVEKKEGRLQLPGTSFVVVDLPGTYSLAPRSPDEMVAVDVLFGRHDERHVPDAVVCIVDASNLERNLYLVSQVLELNRPVVIALNMTDLAESRGITIDARGLQERLDAPVVAIQANRRIGIDTLCETLSEIASQTPASHPSPFPDVFQREVSALEQLIAAGQKTPLPRYLVERLILDTTGYLERAMSVVPLHGELAAARGRLKEAGFPVPAVEAMARYQWVAKVLDGVISRSQSTSATTSDRIDRVLTHRVWGTLVFVFLMALMFQSVYQIAAPVSSLLDQAKSWLAGMVTGAMSEGALRSLVINGMIEGVGSVLVFVPQIFVLFCFIAILEDCGYMARAAYLMDRLMSRVGLNGKSFIPLLSSFACAIPGIMAARVIENPKDRLVTVLVAPLMSCSARLPVYALLVYTFIPVRSLVGFRILGIELGLGLQGLTMLAMYSVGVLAAIGVALVLKKTILRGNTPPFVMELPSYKFPDVKSVLHRMFERGWSFVRRAGTLIFAVTILIWAAAYYPRRESDVSLELLTSRDALQAEVDRATRAGQSGEESREKLQIVENTIEGEYLRHSYLGQLGRWIEPAVKPLGWDWRIGCAAIASFPAREVIVATLGVIYNLGSDVSEESVSLQETLRAAKWEGSDRPVFNIPVALSIMVFFALCAQCASTLVVMKRETNSWKWPAFTFVYMTTLAYIGAFLTYHIGMLFH